MPLEHLNNEWNFNLNDILSFILFIKETNHYKYIIKDLLSLSDDETHKQQKKIVVRDGILP